MSSSSATRDDLRRLAWVLALVWLALAALTTLAQRYLGWRLAIGLIGGAGALFTLGLLLVAAGSIVVSRLGAGDAYQLRAPSSAREWQAYHAIRRTVLFEQRGLVGVYDASHPDDARPGNYPLVLLYKSEPVGAIRVDVEHDEAVFRRVAVRGDAQRLGHGRKMLELAERFARARGKRRVRSHVDPDAVGFYERCGFTREGTDDGERHTVTMRKDVV